MTTEFKKRLAVYKREASRAINYHGGEVNEIKRKALDNVKNQFELDLWREYRNSITTLSYNGDIAMRKGVI